MSEDRFEENIGLVFSTIKRMFGSLEIAGYAARRMGLDLEDFVQVGKLGLFLASERFDPSREINFTNIATKYIRGYILREIDNNDFVKFPRYTPSEIKKEMNQSVISIYKELKGVKDTVGGTIRNAVDVEKEVIQQIDLKNFLDTLTEKQRRVFLLKLEGYTFPQIYEMTGTRRDVASKMFVKAKKRIINEDIIEGSQRYAKEKTVS